MKFNTIGIICEYNPFHFGHLYHINKTREQTGCENLICIMSGSMVQRGEVALFDKWTRAQKAIQAGADLVIELPAYYVLQSADIFAYGAVKILDELNVVDAVSFGSESGDISLLKRAGELLANPPGKYLDVLKDRLDAGDGYPKASEFALRACMDIDSENFFSPNNILAMCYVSAAKKIGSELDFITVKRDNDYHSDASDDGYLSASAIRKMMKSGEDYSDFACDYSCFETFDIKNAESYILGFLRNIPAELLEKTKGHENGMANLVKTAASKACDIDELFDMCVTRRYTLHRIKRFIMCAILGINRNLSCDYVRVLGFNKTGASLLKKIKQCSNLKIITKSADYEGSPAFDTDVASTDFAYLCASNKKIRCCGHDFIHSPYINMHISK